MSLIYEQLDPRLLYDIQKQFSSLNLANMPTTFASIQKRRKNPRVVLTLEHGIDDTVERDELETHNILNQHYSDPKKLLLAKGEYDGLDAIRDYTEDSGVLNYPIWKQHHKIAAEGTKSHHEIRGDVLASLETSNSDIHHKVRKLDEQLHSVRTPMDMHLYAGIKSDPRNSTGMFHNPTYTSTSLMSETAKAFAAPFEPSHKSSVNHVLKILYPKGSSGMYVEPFSGHKGEHEMVLPRGVTFKLTGNHTTEIDPHTQTKTHFHDAIPIHGHTSETS